MLPLLGAMLLLYWSSVQQLLGKLACCSQRHEGCSTHSRTAPCPPLVTSTYRFLKAAARPQPDFTYLPYFRLTSAVLACSAPWSGKLHARPLQMTHRPGPQFHKPPVMDLAGHDTDPGTRKDAKDRKQGPTSKGKGEASQQAREKERHPLLLVNLSTEGKSRKGGA